ncbi:hypothetical protein D3C76_1374210 [compost metagenome]
MIHFLRQKQHKHRQLTSAEPGTDSTASHGDVSPYVYTEPHCVAKVAWANLSYRGMGVDWPSTSCIEQSIQCGHKTRKRRRVTANPYRRWHFHSSARLETRLNLSKPRPSKLHMPRPLSIAIGARDEPIHYAKPAYPIPAPALSSPIPTRPGTGREHATGTGPR